VENGRPGILGEVDQTLGFMPVPFGCPDQHIVELVYIPLFTLDLEIEDHRRGIETQIVLGILVSATDRAQFTADEHLIDHVNVVGTFGIDDDIVDGDKDLVEEADQVLLVFQVGRFDPLFLENAEKLFLVDRLASDLAVAVVKLLERIVDRLAIEILTISIKSQCRIVMGKVKKTVDLFPFYQPLVIKALVEQRRRRDEIHIFKIFTEVFKDLIITGSFNDKELELSSLSLSQNLPMLDDILRGGVEAQLVVCLILERPRQVLIGNVPADIDRSNDQILVGNERTVIVLPLELKLLNRPQLIVPKSIVTMVVVINRVYRLIFQLFTLTHPQSLLYLST
jgi:hypothetical protein